MSTEPKHTPGPWKAETFVDNRRNGSDHYILRITPQRGVYGSMYEPDAVLAAAAPTMLAALKDVFDFLKRSGYDTRLIREVIAKAEGGAP